MLIERTILEQLLVNSQNCSTNLEHVFFFLHTHVYLQILQYAFQNSPKPKSMPLTIIMDRITDINDINFDDDLVELSQAPSYIHIRLQQHGRKLITTVQGIPEKFNLKKIMKVIKKKFSCNGHIIDDLEMGQVIHLQGDQRKEIQEFLTDKEGLELNAKSIKIYGF